MQPHTNVIAPLRPLEKALCAAGWSPQDLDRAADIRDKRHRATQLLAKRAIPTADEADRIQVVFAERGVWLDVSEVWPRAYDSAGSACAEHLPVHMCLWLRDDSPSPDMSVSRDEDARLVASALSAMTDEREKHVLVRRFGLDGRRPERLSDIGERMGVWREAVRVYQKKALRRLRQYVLLHDRVLLLEHVKEQAAAGRTWEQHRIPDPRAVVLERARSRASAKAERFGEPGI